MVQRCSEALRGEDRAFVAGRRVERFAAGAAPAATTVGSLCTFASTTLSVFGAAPFEVGNVLLDFLETQAASRITKINYRKMTVKAEVSGGIGWCSAKLRVCRREGGVSYVEFQRRDGDCISFSHLYQQASRYIQLRGLEVANAPRVAKESTSVLRPPEPPRDGALAAKQCRSQGALGRGPLERPGVPVMALARQARALRDV
uniref:Uncharacterized protein n=1 Tax=Alexandrium catenella TaxID=2925 RepID=A0A7S1S578_ALECA|mmetsp:Transcript_85784/g.227997  ORF Transcript_85784/g.227997 Transcript_85784/m.227997 type:complete len:202 (+) Transcript_85784:73-678(+)